MKFLYLRAAGSSYDLPRTLEAMGHQVDILNGYEFDIHPVDAEVTAMLDSVIGSGAYDFAVSYLFFGAISDVCQKHDLKYLCWIYDSPLATLYHDALHNDVNYLFVFDKREQERLSAEHLPHLYHLPMAANTQRAGQLNVTSDDIAAFSHAVSFIGSLYEDNAFNMTAPFLSDALAAEAKELLLSDICDWHEPKKWRPVSGELLEFFVQNTGFTFDDAGSMDPALYLGLAFYTRKSAELDRITVLNAVSQLVPVDLYTAGKSGQLLPGVHIHPKVDYDTTSCKIFHLSKINLNITLPSIESGLPQRVFDIMACGGFVLTNYQPEIDDLFEIGREIEVFRDQSELLEKVRWYLSHEQERLQIAINGYQKVCQAHNYPTRIQTMLDLAGQP